MWGGDLASFLEDLLSGVDDGAADLHRARCDIADPTADRPADAL
jgi:hypothetical protein